MSMYNVTAKYFNKDHDLNYNGFMSAILEEYLSVYFCYFPPIPPIMFNFTFLFMDHNTIPNLNFIQVWHDNVLYA